MLMFKSMEITVRAQGERRYPPLFVPMNFVRRAYEIPRDQEHELVRLLFENVNYSEAKKEFELETEKLADQLSVLISRLRTTGKGETVKKVESPGKTGRGKATFISPVKDPNVRKPISTSYLQGGTELQIRIAFPCIEYHNENKGVIVEKTLTAGELDRYFGHPCGFDPEWHYIAYKTFTLNTQFNLLRYRKPGHGTTRYSLDGGLRPIAKNSVETDMMQAPSANGYFEKGGALGKLLVKGFSFSIQGISKTTYQKRTDFDIEQWDKLLSIGSTTDMISALLCNFLRSTREGLSDARIARLLNKVSASTPLKDDILPNVTTSRIVSRDQLRYLVELSLPAVTLTINGESTTKPLTYQDCRHLHLTSFKDWKEFLMRTYFRLELNVTDPIPSRAHTREQASAYQLDRTETVDEREEDDLTESSDLDYAKRFPPSQGEVMGLEQTQKKIEFWFRSPMDQSRTVT